MVRKSLGPSHLSQVLKYLQKEPHLVLPDVKALKVKLALRNNHFGARHFVKEELPRIRWANPDLDIAVSRVPKQKSDSWDAELEVSFNNGTSHTFILSEKWSSTIVRELMDMGGGSTWVRWKAQALEAGIPVVPGEEKIQQPLDSEKKNVPPRPSTLAPWKLLRAKNLAARMREETQPQPLEAQTLNPDETILTNDDRIEEGDGPRVKQLFGPGAVSRPAEKPKSLRGPAEISP